MYRIYADDTLIYDSTLEDYKIGKGQITKEADKSGSFVFSVYPDHPYYSQFVRMKTVVTVYKSGRIVFRGRILDDTTDYWNAKTLTCEGELGFLQDSVARPFDFEGSPADLLARFIAEHNSQHESRDEWKQFKVGTVTVVDENGQITRSAGGYGTMLDTMQSALPDSALGGHFYITHGDDGTDPIPTLHYVADYPKTAAQGIEFGVNLKDYTKKVSATDLATCIIPLGASNGSDGERLTIEAKNGGKDYIYDQNAVAMYGWIVKVVTWDDVTLDNHLLTKGRAWLAASVNEHATIELNAIDLHLLDRSIESYNVCEYVHATSKPHGLDALMLCSKQTMDLLKPDNDTVTLGYSYGTFTGANVKLGASVSTLGKTMSSIKQEADEIAAEVVRQGESMTKLELLPSQLTLSVTNNTANTSASIQLAVNNEDGTTTLLGSAQNINLTGLVTFESLKAGGTTQIDGSRITTGTIKAERLELTGAITWGDLATAVQNDINDAYAMAEDAETAVGDITYTYNGKTYIDEDRIMAGSVIAGHLMGGEVSLLTAAERQAGGLDITGSSSSTYAIELWSNGALRMVADEGAAYLEAGGEHLTIDYVSGMGYTVSVSNTLMPNDNGSIDLGAYVYYWDNAYINQCYGSAEAASTSDRNKKHDISYDLDRYDPFFDGLKPAIFRLNNGTSGRLHPGLIAQDVEEDLEQNSIPTSDFAGFIKMEDSYALRYGEFIALLIWQVQRLKARVARLEESA